MRSGTEEADRPRRENNASNLIPDGKTDTPGKGGTVSMEEPSPPLAEGLRQRNGAEGSTTTPECTSM